MTFKLDNHIHTIYSGHADKDMTIGNIIKKAERAGLSRIAITEHAFDWHMGPKGNLSIIRKEVARISTHVRIDIGLEIDPDTENPGELHFNDFEKSEIYPVLVGFHGYPGVNRGWFEKINFTRREKNRIYSKWLKIMHKLIENPKVDILAHPGRIIMQNSITDEFSGSILKDFQDLGAAARQYKVAFEINEALLSSIPTEKLQKSYEQVIQIMIESDVKLSVGSDAHKLDKIGQFSHVSELAKCINLQPENLLTNCKGERNEKEIHPDRIARRDRDHRDTRQHVTACVE
jgi:histidinol phosphatase-like PHP family hydrolase